MKKINKVMLVYPNQRWLKEDLTTTWDLTPYTICLLAAMIRNMVEVKILDCQIDNLSREQFRDEIRRFNPDLVGISLMSSEYAEIGNMATDDIKSINRGIVIVAGGVHVTTQPESLMRDLNIDYAVNGEGEYVLQKLIKYLNDEAPYPTEGLIRRKENGEIEILPRVLVEDLDSLPIPAYELIDYLKYANKVPRYGTDSPSAFPAARFPTSRGCPIGCTFCQVGKICGNKLRVMSPERVMKELRFLKQNYNIQFFKFEDDNAFFYRERTKKLLQMIIDENLNLKWKATGVFLPTLDEEIFSLMARSGCEMINIAVESGNKDVLRTIVKKPVDLDKVPEKIALAQKYGLYVIVNVIVGLPGETWDQIRETLKYAETCGADYVKIFLAIPLQGTEMYGMAKQGGYIVGDETKVNQRYSVMKGVDFGPKDLNILRVYEWDRINFADPIKRKRTADVMGISVEELNKIRKETRDTLNI